MQIKKTMTILDLHKQALDRQQYLANKEIDEILYMAHRKIGWVIYDYRWKLMEAENWLNSFRYECYQRFDESGKYYWELRANDYN